MNKFAILLLFTIFIVNALNNEQQVGSYSCLQDQLDLSEIVPDDYLETFDEKYGHRKLQQYDPQPIRITLDFQELDNPMNGGGMTPNVKEYLKKIMYAAQIYLAKLIKVYPRQQPIKISMNQEKCHDITLPENIKTTGIYDSDIHIYVTFLNNANYTALANAIWCQLDPNPTVGRVQFNIGKMNLNESSTQAFQDNFSTSLHEILHILGFSGNSVKYWIDPDTNRPYGEQNAHKVFKRETRWEVDNVVKVSSKNILKVSRIHYGCPSIDGMYLENQGGPGSMGSHWERDLLANEFMTASIVYRVYTISEFTAALLLDTGYYAEINSNLLMPIYWGKNKGCDFFHKTCKAGKEFPEFPDNNVEESCDFYSEAIGTLQNYDYYSQCKIIYSFSNGYCSSEEFQPDEQLRQNTGKGSRCFRSNANIKGYDVLDMKGRCFKAQCAKDLSSIQVNVWGDEYVKCSYPNQIINLAEQTKTTQGTMKCPHDFDLFCNFPKSCPNNCSNNGVCNNGYCVCLNGYAGDDCSQRCPDGYAWDTKRCVYKCPQGYFKNFDNTCKPTCPYKQFEDQATSSCALCPVNCSACFGSAPNQCLSCNDGYSLQGNKCVEATCHSSCQSCSGPNSNQCTSCPAGKYLDSRNTCQYCQQPCENCYKSATECTTCSYGYFMDRFSGKCVSENSCDSSCLDCSAFRDPTKCTSCRDGFFVNNEGRCQKCDESCSTCTQKSTNCIKCTKGWEYDAKRQICYMNCHESCSGCTAAYDPKSCKRCAFNYVMLNNVCVPCDKSCYGCRENPSKCTDCERGYKLDKYNNICIPACRQNEFQDRNGDCVKCQSPCATCQIYDNYCLSCIDGYAYDDLYKTCNPKRNACHEHCGECSRFDDINACTTCKDGMYLQSGRCQYCSESCQTCEKESYICTSCKKNEFLQNKQCLQCHSSCLTCSGIATNCTSCQEGYSVDPKTGICVDSKPICNSNEYMDRDYKCQKCYEPCASCYYYPNRCTSCITGFKLNPKYSSCEHDYVTCKQGEFLAENNQCKPCDSSCTTCELQSTRCTSCKDGFTLSRNSCLSSDCQDGSFRNQQGKCQRCNQSCSKCVNTQDSCIECNTGYIFDPRTQRCIINQSNQKCHPSCKECSEANNPSACKSCFDGSYINNRGQCLKCDSSCLTCNRFSNYCTSCQKDFELDSSYGRCIPVCKSGQFLDQQDNTCKNCTSPCQTCQFYSTQCTSCISGYEHNKISYSCDLVCPSGQYKDRGQSCKPCSSPCATCEFYDNRCLSCVSGYTLNNTMCNKNSNSSLRSCHESCNTCTKAMDPRSCDSCREGYALTNGSCQKKRK
ncbi:hypothetical protein ABPG74_009411 [Tetrahymena malaccensis]